MIDTIPECGFEGAELIPNLSNQLVADLIWPKIYTEKGNGHKIQYEEVLKMHHLSKFWIKFVDHTNALLHL
jgi:hypothetical protein